MSQIKLSEEQAYVANRLAFLLRMHKKSGSRTRRMTIKTIPLDNDLMFDHISLRKIMTPSAPSEGIFNERVFEAFLYPLIDGDGTPEEGLRATAGDAVADYVMAGDSIEEQVVRLTFLCSNAEGATASFDKDSFLITHDDKVFGIEHGQIRSGFCSELKFDINPEQALTHVKDRRVFDDAFCSLYREALRRGRGLSNALTALLLGQPGFKFKLMAEEADPCRFPSSAKLKQWEHVLNHELDPVAKMYRIMVPRWMTPSQFNRTFTCLSLRPVNPRASTITKLINQMHYFFHKNKKEK